MAGTRIGSNSGASTSGPADPWASHLKGKIVPSLHFCLCPPSLTWRAMCSPQVYHAGTVLTSPLFRPAYDVAGLDALAGTGGTPGPARGPLPGCCDAEPSGRSHGSPRVRQGGLGEPHRVGPA